MHSRRKSRRPRYRVIGGIPSVELKLRTPRQLFDERDPAPFRERDLDDDAVEYIVTSVQELKDQHDVRLSLYFESLGEFENNPGDITRAIHQFFRYEADMKRRALREIFHHGFISLAIGMTFLTLCVWFAHGLNSSGPVPMWESLMHEGLLLMGWVSMWKPISIFLYEWWPIAEDMSLFKRLSEVDVEIAPLRPGVVAPAVQNTSPVHTTGSVAVAVKPWPTQEKLERATVS
jgi:hypothetical protein